MRSALVSGVNRLFVHSFCFFFFCANKVLALEAISISFFCLHFNLKNWGKTAAWQIYGFLRFTRRRCWCWSQMRNRSGYKLNIFPLFASTEEPMQCRDALLKQTKVLNISYKFLYTNRWLIRCRRRVESKVSGSLLCIQSAYTHPDNAISAAASYYALLIFRWKEVRTQPKICQNIYVSMLSLGRATYQSFSENLHCKCFRMANDDNIFSSRLFILGCNSKTSHAVALLCAHKKKFLREFLKRIYGQFSRCLFVQLIQEHIVR